jgi:hypothetical protein
MPSNLKQSKSKLKLNDIKHIKEVFRKARSTFDAKYANTAFRTLLQNIERLFLQNHSLQSEGQILLKLDKQQKEFILLYMTEAVNYKYYFVSNVKMMDEFLYVLNHYYFEDGIFNNRLLLNLLLLIHSTLNKDRNTDYFKEVLYFVQRIAYIDVDNKVLLMIIKIGIEVITYKRISETIVAIGLLSGIIMADLRRAAEILKIDGLNECFNELMKNSKIKQYTLHQFIVIFKDDNSLLGHLSDGAFKENINAMLNTTNHGQNL